MHIVLSADKNYIMPTAVTMKSVCVNNQEVHFHLIIDDSVTEAMKRQLSGVVSAEKQQTVSFYKVDKQIFASFPALGKVKTYISAATYYRLYLTELLPSTVDRVIYLDGDIIVRDCLSELWEFSLNECPIAAVPDMAECQHDYHRLGYEPDLGYFNAGVLLINLAYWREKGCLKHFMHIITEEAERIKLHDQDVLNITFAQTKQILPLGYNFQNGFLFKKEYRECGDKYDRDIEEYWNKKKKIVILHFTDTIKPWHLEDCNPYGYEFFKYYKMTPFGQKKLKHCGKNLLRYYVGMILRKVGLLSAKKSSAYQYTSMVD